MQESLKIKLNKTPKITSLLILTFTASLSVYGFPKVMAKLHGFAAFKVAVAAVLLSLFFFAFIVIFTELTRKNPGLTVSNEGIVDRSSRGAAGLITWADIEGFTLTANSLGHRLLVVQVHNPAEYLNRGSKSRRTIRQSRYDLFQSPIVLSRANLKCNFDELKRELERRLEAAKQTG